MTYLRVLVGRWSRRDRLAVLVIALTVALLVGAALLVVAAGDQTRSLAAEYDGNASVDSYDDVDEATRTADPEDVVLPTATAVDPGGEAHRVVAIPEDASTVGLPDPPEGTVAPGVDVDAGNESWRLEGSTGTAATTVGAANGDDTIPPTWVRTTPETLAEVGPTGALVVSPSSEGDAPLIGALEFFTHGAADVLGIVRTGIAAAGVIVAVTLSSVVRMTIRDRARTIRVVRATGASPRRVRLAFAARAGAIATVGGVLGYAIGTIVTNAAVTAAVVVGLPTTLSVAVTPEILRLVVAMLAAVGLVGVATGYVTARAATAKPPARVGREESGGSEDGPRGRVRRVGAGVRRRLGPSVLAPRTILPATATLSTFAVIVLLVASLGTVGASLGTAGTAIAEPDAAHPADSRVSADYAESLEQRGIPASPEILLFASHDEEPYLVRGADYGAFASVSDPRLVEGTEPTADEDAVVGVELADALGVGPGDELVVGGSTDAAVGMVTVVGTVETGGFADHQLLVSLPTARHLSALEGDDVNQIRTAAAPAEDADGEAVTVVDVDGPAHVAPGESVTAEATVWNPTAEDVERTLEAQLGDDEASRTVEIEPYEHRTVAFELATSVADEYELTVGDVTSSVVVADAAPLESPALPASGPPGASLSVPVETIDGEPVSNATVRVGNRTAETGADGVAGIELPADPGTYEATVRAGEREHTASIRVARDADRDPATSVSISPSSPSVHAQPTAAVELVNPWNRSVESPIELAGAEASERTTVALEPGETTTRTTTLSRQPPGNHSVAVATGDRTLATTEYEVVGDDRVVSALAASGHHRADGGIETAIEYAVGNLQVLLGALTALAAVTVVGATSAVLARAIRARRRTLAIYRATGASPRRLLGIVLGDAARIGVVASAAAVGVAVGVLELLAVTGRLTAFGISLAPRPTATVALAVFGGGLVLTLVAALVATLPILQRPPASLLAASSARIATDRRERSAPGSEPEHDQTD
ncbi:FtsX-like permease family protein [Natronococcus occultus]|uniref:ABC-type antimicrobial peptide transport system, permease component n=1 Tax=Natronococcus occultus SP4 TaxID=694430 RepID=L0K0W9_9EURY|nr:FtsX-like permease family protein [Natronococcus occultus]AGB38646.1 ABC-type antimicrobial peptide transport system, permease component [Natronococcus occultus SP4]